MSAQEKPATTFYSSSTNETTELGWKLKRLAETHEMRQRRLMREFKAKSEALTAEMQAEQSTVFDDLRTEIMIPNEAWGDGMDWGLNIEDLDDGTVALVHDEDPSRKVDDCDCPICQLRRSLQGTLEDDEDIKVVH